MQPMTPNKEENEKQGKEKDEGKEGNEKRKEKDEGKGLSGLVNLGNTCFMNSCMQVLSHTHELNNFLSNPSYKKKLTNKPESVLLLEWDNLRTALWKENQPVNPSRFSQVMRRLAHIKGANLFSGFEQNDVSEFFMFIIDNFHSAVSREVTVGISGDAKTNEDRIAVICYNMMKEEYSKNYSEFVKIFFGTMVNQIISIETKEELSIKAEQFCTLSLPVPEQVVAKRDSPCSLTDCFKLFADGEILSGDNSYFNEKTGKKEEVIKKMSLWCFPTILVIDLKRFNSQNTKNQTLVSFPLDNLDLSEYVIGYDKESYVYDLYGICNHSGNVLGGHYTSFVKNANGKWYLFNDSSVMEVNSSQLISSKAYCLFYRKKTIK
jgi:ubiquitin carboxyl-terminal hydrolase 8